MTVKFIQYFDIFSEKDEEYRRFVSKNYIPTINQTGLVEMVGSWHVAAGEGPYHIMEAASDSVKSVNKLLQLEEFKKLTYLFHFLITNYKTKIMVPMGWVESRIPGEPNFRFNHHYDIRSENYDAYSNFMKEEYMPVMEKQGIKMIGGWEVAIGPGPNIIMESACAGIKQILDTIGSPVYKSLTEKLLDLVCNFGSKILVPTGLIP